MHQSFLLKNYLLKHTQLQVSYSINAVAIIDRKPVLMTIINMLESFVKYQNQIVLASHKFDLEKALTRKEIVEGLIKAVKVIDDIIEVIRKSTDKDNAKQRLTQRFNFTLNQAEAIVQLRLYRLSQTDLNQLTEELKTLLQKVDFCKKIIENDQFRKEFMVISLRKVKQDFATKRKSTISGEIEEIKVDISNTIELEDVHTVITRDGYLKAVSKKTYDSNK